MVKYKCLCYDNCKDDKGYCAAGVKVTEADPLFAECEECIFLAEYVVTVNETGLNGENRKQ